MNPDMNMHHATKNIKHTGMLKVFYLLTTLF